MPATHRRPIRRQVLVFAFILCGTVLLTSGVVLFFHHLGQTRSRLAESLRVITQTTASNALSAVAFGDAKVATELLGSLRHDPLIVSAVLYDKNNQMFASYGRVVANLPPTDPDPDVSLLVDIVFEGEKLGRLLVVTDNLTELHRTALTWISVYAGAFLLTGLLAYALATGFQRAVAAPITDLARTAAAVTRDNDYAARVVPRGPAEVAALAEAFNTMLAEIGRRDAELARQLTALDKEMHEREAAEASLRQNTRELLRVSREAGMAEVATGVLHNIGNALNSINVSAELLADHLRARTQSSVSTLRDFLREPPPKAAPVFSTHPDGPGVLAFTSSVAEHALNNLEIASRELTSLRTGVAHLKDIVARQQTLAKSSRHSESFDVREAVKEALLLDKTQDHDALGALRIEQTCEGPPLVYSDRSAVVQILVNLLTNARAAIVANLASGRPPLLTIRIGPPSATHLPLLVIDNGIGIPAHQLLSIFSYGFTTKAGGHGFGLHNAANTARLLGGSLRVHSEGSGLGATFTLDLPRNPPLVPPS